MISTVHNNEGASMRNYQTKTNRQQQCGGRTSHSESRTLTSALAADQNEGGFVMEKLNTEDYVEIDGVKTVTFIGMDKRIKNLYEIQNIQRPKMIEHIERLGYEIIEHDRVSDGWGDGFKIDQFVVKDLRTDETLVFSGGDDNKSIWQTYESGGRGLEYDIPGNKSWHEFGKGV